MAKPIEDVAIIGAGLGGTALAIALHQQSISCRLYEVRDEETTGAIASGVLLQVNGCKVLDALGVLPRVAERCFKVEGWTWVDDATDAVVRVDETSLRTVYGHANHRLYRSVLLAEMKAMLKEYGVPIFYGSRFDGVIDEQDEDETATGGAAAGVAFTINGKTEKASLLIGADGIHSTVRKHLTSLVPKYSGMMAAYGHIRADSVKWPRPDFPCTAFTLQSTPGSLVLVSEVADGSELLVGYQFKYPDQDRAGWDALAADPDRVAGFFMKDYDRWHSTGRAIIDALCGQQERDKKLSIWPFRQMPQLDRWASLKNRVVLVGDAAHALPASSAQGVNMAVEDVYSLALLLGSAGPETKLGNLLQFWRDRRQTRIDYVMQNTAVTDVLRMSKEEREKMEKEGKLKDLPITPEASKELMHRIYMPNIEEDLAAWIGEQQKPSTSQ